MLLAHAPEPDLLERGGAKEIANRLRKAVQLRDDCREAKGAVAAAEREVKAAEQRDRVEHAKAIARSRSAVLEPKHKAGAEEALEAAERRYQALILAVEDSTAALLEIAEDEAGGVAVVARRQREASAADIRRASEQVIAALDSFEQVLGAARWTSDPQTRRWRPALRTAEVGKVRLDKVLASLDALGDWLEQLPLPGEEPEEPTIRFRWSGIGQVAPPPGS
jgi:hypothetical protein